MSDTPNVFVECAGPPGANGERSFYTYAEIIPCNHQTLWAALAKVKGSTDLPNPSLLVMSALSRKNRTGNEPKGLRAFTTKDVAEAHRALDENDLAAILALMKAIETFHAGFEARLVVWTE